MNGSILNGFKGILYVFICLRCRHIDIDDFRSRIGVESASASNAEQTPSFCEGDSSVCLILNFAFDSAVIMDLPFDLARGSF
jgi:hypothetical protein